MPETRALPALDDNYIWLLTDPAGGDAVVVDPGDADPVLAALETAGLRLGAVLVTHRHGDHVAGIGELARAFPGLPVIGPRDPRIRGLTEQVGEGAVVTPPGLGTTLRVLEVPGHTTTHIAYLGAGRLFCGDTLFAGGCGRVFDGTFEQLSQSLRRIAALDPTTLIHCAHEYTLANLGFARWVEPDNAALAARIAADTAARARGEPTVPSTLALELATNPFLRTGEPGVIAAAETFAGRTLSGHAAVFEALRRWKDSRYD